MTTCELNQIFLGEIASIQNYGAFIRIPGCSVQGLIHRSQVLGEQIRQWVSTAHVDDVAEVLQIGERVWCKVISIGDDGKIGLSMKLVNQGNGTDLDPNGVQLQRDLQKKKSVGRYERKAIQLEAVLNTTCTKCGTAGHLSKDCFMTPDGKKYELIPEIEEEATRIVVQAVEDTSKNEKKHKGKKLKKRKKAKKYKQHSDDSDSDGKEVVKKKKKKYSKDEKKRKEKSNNSGSENSGDNFSSHDVKAHKRKHSENVEKRTKKCKHSKSKYAD